MGKQMRIAGTEGQRIVEIDTAAEAYVAVRDKRMAATKKEVEGKVALIAAMRKAKVEVYRDDDHSPPLLVTLKPGKDAVKVEEIEASDGAED